MTAAGDPLLDCEGEMAERLAAYDWSGTPLGPLDSWSQSLRTSVAIVLRSRYPMLLSWGEDLVMLYNDAFIPTRYQAPRRLRRPAPPRVRRGLGRDRPDAALGAGRRPGNLVRGPPLDDRAPSRVEEAFFTFSYSHVPDESGTGGVLAVLTVTTDKVVAARRLALLNQLAMVGTQATAPDQAMAAALAVLAGASGGPALRALYAEGLATADEPPGLFRTGSFGSPTTTRCPTSSTRPIIPCRSRGPNGNRRYRHRPDVTRWWAARCTGQPSHSAARTRLRPFCCSPGPLRPVDEDHQRFLSLVADQFAQILAVATARAREHARLEALAALDAAKTAFLSNVSHEFRTPLTLLLAPLEDVLDGRAATIGREDAEVMHLSAHRLLRMVNALLDVARIEADGLAPSPEAERPLPITRAACSPSRMQPPARAWRSSSTSTRTWGPSSRTPSSGRRSS